MTLPSHWVSEPISKLCDKVRGVSYERAEARTVAAPGHVPILRANNIDDQLVFDDLVWVPEARVSSKQYLRDGDVVVAMSSGSKKVVGKTAQARGGWQGSFGAFCAVLRPSSSIDAKLFGHFFRTSTYRNTISDLAAGTNINNIKNEHFDQIEVPFPSDQAEQRRIANKLDQITIRLDDSRARLDTIPAILKRFRMAVLAAACSGRLTEDWRKQHPECSQEGLAALELKRISAEKRKWALENLAMHSEAKRLLKRLAELPPQLETDESIPSSWIKATMSELCHLVVDCHNKTAPYAESGIPLVRTTNVKDGQLILDGIKYVTDETYSFWSRRCPPESGDIIFTREAPIGDACIVPDGHTVCLGQRTMLFRTWHGLSSNTYLLYAILSPIFRTQYEDYAVGGGVVHLRVGDVEGLRVPVPPYNEQLEIVRRVQAMFDLATTIEARYRKAKTFTDKLMPAVLAKAFRGELIEQGEEGIRHA